MARFFRPAFFVFATCILCLTPPLISCKAYIRTDSGYKEIQTNNQDAKPTPPPTMVPDKASTPKSENADEGKKNAQADKDAGQAKPEEHSGVKETELSHEAEGAKLAPAGEPAPIPMITTLIPAPAPPAEGNDKRKASTSLVVQGRNATALNKFDEAERNFEDAISMDPQNPYAYHFFAEARFVAGSYEQSANLCDKAIELASSPQWKARSLVLRAKDRSNMKKFNKAAEDCDAAIELDPSNVEARILLGKLRQ